VVHGGTIMSVMEKYAVPKGNYYDFQVKNGQGYITEFDGEKIKVLENI
jgi:alpha-ribazole phosphatase